MFLLKNKGIEALNYLLVSFFSVVAFAELTKAFAGVDLGVQKSCSCEIQCAISSNLQAIRTKQSAMKISNNKSMVVHSKMVVVIHENSIVWAGVLWLFANAK